MSAFKERFMNDGAPIALDYTTLRARILPVAGAFCAVLLASPAILAQQETSFD